MHEDEKTELAAAAERMDITKQKEHLLVSVEPSKQVTDKSKIRLGG